MPVVFIFCIIAVQGHFRVNQGRCILTEGIRSQWFQVLNRVSQGCTVAPDLFLNPMDWILNRTVEQSPLGVSIGREHFADLDYADDVALLEEMLQTLVAGLLVLQDEAAPRTPDKLDRDKDSASQGTTSCPTDSPGGSRECRFGERLCVPRLADIPWRRK